MPAVSDAEILRLTKAHQQLQAREAAQLAALVAMYFRTKVSVDDPSSIERWLQIMIPRIIAGRSRSASLAAAFGDALRKLELPGVNDSFHFDKASALDESVVRTSLSVVGTQPLAKKYAEIRTSDMDPAMKQATMAKELDVASARIAGSTARHVQNGGRDSLYRGITEDKKALGYVRVTKSEHPCFFCTMLASRGLVYSNDSFDESNARFTGAHNVKVHDSCACSLKPAYRRNDPFLSESDEWRQMWADNIEGKYSGQKAILAWRQLYETGTITI